MSYLKSERHFRLYESYLRAIVDAWPATVTLEPRPPIASPATLETRIRLCKSALKSELSGPVPTWELGDFPIAKFLMCCDEFIVSSNVVPGKVVCGPEDMVQRLAPTSMSALELSPTQVIPTVNLVEPSLDLVNAVVVLHHFRLLSEPSVLRTGFDIAALVKEHSYDVAVEKDGDTYTVL